MKYKLTFKQWERVLDYLVLDATAALYECYDTIEDMLCQYDDDHNQEFTIEFKGCSAEALQELEDIIGGLQ
jgi:hypothetical protein